LPDQVACLLGEAKTEVVESGGDPRWIDAATAALSKWKFEEGIRRVQKKKRFDFKFED